MEAYTGFAEVYDELMDNIPYEEWTEYLIGLMREYGVTGGTVCELGCGTGNVTELLAKAGYDMIGIDNSDDMLMMAREKLCDGSDILYLNQDMRKLELFGTVDAIVSICDSMNYILDEDDLTEVFRKANNYLEKDGLLIFDMNTEHKYRDILADSTIAENREDCSFIWENYYDEESGINEYDLTVYVQEEDELYRRYDEVHRQKAYSLEKIKSLLANAGMVFVDAFDAFTHEPVREDSERIYIIAREGFQEGKLYIKMEE